MKERPGRGMVGAGDWLSSANTLVRTCEIMHFAVTPVKTGVQKCLNSLDSGFRRNDNGRYPPIISQVLTLRRLHSLALGFGTFACAKDRASSPRDGLLKDNRPPALISYYCSVGG